MVPSASSETDIGSQSSVIMPEIIVNGNHRVQSASSEIDIDSQSPDMPEISTNENYMDSQFPDMLEISADGNSVVPSASCVMITGSNYHNVLEISTNGNSVVPSASSEGDGCVQSPDIMPEIDCKVEVEDWKISSYDTVGEEVSSCPDQDQVKPKAEKVRENGPKVERCLTQPDQLTCFSCHVVFEAVADLTEHVLVYHGKNILHCQLCKSFVYGSKTQFAIHVATHNQCSTERSTSPFHENGAAASAEVGGKLTSSEFLTDNRNTCCADPLEESTTHMVLNGCREQNETGSADASEQVVQRRKYYTCSLCDKKHGSKGSLQSHMGLHSKGKKSESCEFCGAKLKSRTELLHHITSVHGKKNFLCSYCQESFLDKISKEEHERLHTGDSLFKCGQSDKVFQAKSVLDQHKKAHSKCDDLFHYKCDHCDKKFQFHSFLASHLKKCIGLQRYDCSMHNKGSSHKFDLKRYEMQFNHQISTLSRKKKSQSVRVGACETSVSSKNSEVGPEFNLMNDSTDLRKNASRDKSQNVKISNIKLYDSFCFQCTLCPKKFSLYTVLAAHMLKHKKEMFECNYCVQNFHNKVELQKHVLETHCSIAQNTDKADTREFKREAAVMVDDNDGKLNEVLNPYAVESVSAQNSNTCRVHDHASKKITFTEQINISDDKSADGSNVSQEFHSWGGQPNTNRSNTFDTEYSLTKGNNKIRGDRNAVMCHVCGKYFQQKYGLIRHLQSVHERRRDFKCSFCKKGFSEKVGRDEHERIHTGEKPHRCDLCDKVFRAKALLYVHKRYHLKTHESFRFQCMHCPKKFPFQSALTKHMRKHTGERQYICSNCSRGFYCKIDLTKHMLRRHPHTILDTVAESTAAQQNENVLLDGIETDQTPSSLSVTNAAVLTVDVTYGENYRSHLVHNPYTGAVLKSYKCDECGKICYEKRSLEVHKRIHTGERPHTCQTCGLQFRQTGALCRHLRNVHEGRRDFACNVCGKRFGEKASCDDHVRIHTGERPYPCGLCPKYCISRTALLIHKKSHSDILLHKCIICGKCFRYSGSLGRHMKIHTGEEIHKSHQCKECEKCFSTRSELKSHERTHTKEKPFTCEHCGKQFKFCGALRRHVNSLHEGRKDFTCHICGKCFSEKVACDNHVRVHTGERPFNCEICGKDFKTKSSVYIHKKCHSEVYAASCPTCQKPFRFKSSLSIHLRTHTGERPHPCDICDKRFATNRDMLKHRAIHSDEKPFECAICGMAFRLKRSLLNHLFKNHVVEETKS